jgi:hypothetical protein
MVVIVPQGPWTYELNWDLHTENTGEICMPFHLCVQQRDTSPEAKDFPQFMQLPAELQLAVFRFCNEATLFSLMSVSSYTRKEAGKLFWSSSEFWYLIPAPWLIGGGFPGHTFYAVDFLACVTHVEIEFDGMFLGPDAWEEVPVYPWRTRPPVCITDEEIRTLWAAFQHRFPHATDVVLSQRSSDAMDFPAPTYLSIIAERCPAHIRTSMSCFRHETGYPERGTRVLWQQDHSRNSQPATAWKPVDLDWRRLNVFPPPRNFTGPVGVLTRERYHGFIRMHKKSARRVLLQQAVEAHYLHEVQGPCVCPDPGCDLEFEQPGQWTIHAMETGHDFRLEPPSQHFKTLFEENSAKMIRIGQECADAVSKLRTEGGEKGSEQRRVAEQAFLAQLHADPSYAQDEPPEECELFCRYRREMDDPEDWFATEVADEKARLLL